MQIVKAFGWGALGVLLALLAAHAAATGDVVAAWVLGGGTIMVSGLAGLSLSWRSRRRAAASLVSAVGSSAMCVGFFLDGKPLQGVAMIAITALFLGVAVRFGRS